MIIVRKSFKISVHPDEKERVRKHLVEIGASILSVRYFKTEIYAIPITKVYIEGSLEKDKMNDFIEWIDKNIKSVVSITI